MTHYAILLFLLLILFIKMMGILPFKLVLYINVPILFVNNVQWRDVLIKAQRFLLNALNAKIIII